MSRDRKPKRKVNPTYCILVDGQTEQWYLQLMKQHENVRTINIKPELFSKKKLQDQYEFVKEYSSMYDKVVWIIDFDTLIKEHTTEEIVTVLAHEIGHYKMKYTLKGIVMSVLQTGIMLYIISLFIGNPVLSEALGAEQGSFHMGILAFGLLYSPLSLLLGIFGNIISRKYEFQADKYAGEKYNVKALQDALKKLSVNNLSNLRPHPLYVFFHYSHPPLLQRLKKLEEISNK